MKIKKFIAAAISSAMVFTSVFSSSAFAADGIIYGDVNGDHIVTALDASMIVNRVLGNITDFNAQQEQAAKVSGNSEISINDASLVLQKVLNNSYLFPVESTTEAPTQATTEAPIQTTTKSSAENTTETPVETTTNSSQEENGVSWKFNDDEFTPYVNSSDNPVSIPRGTSIKGLTFNNDGKVLIDSGSITYENVKYVNYINFNGGGKPAENSVAFDVDGPCKITAIVRGSDTEVRNLGLQSNAPSSERFSSTDILTDAPSKVTINYTGEAGTVNLFSQGSKIRVYYINVKYGDDSSEESSSEQTSSEQTTSSENPPEDTTSSTPGGEGQNVSVKFDSENFAALIPTAAAIVNGTVVDGITFITADGNKMKVEEANKKFNGEAYTACISLGGTGSKTKNAIAFDVEGPCKIDVVAVSGNKDTPRPLNLYDDNSDEPILSNTVTGGDLVSVSYDYTGSAGKVYLSSGSSGIRLYALSITY